MAIITQPELALWGKIEKTPEMLLLVIVLESMTDEDLMRKLEKDRKNGRNDYPVRYMWNLQMARIILGHPTLASFHRELMRNPTLIQLCGAPFRNNWYDAVPSLDALYNFRSKLAEFYVEEVEAIFHDLLGRGIELLTDLGEHLAVDSTALDSAGRKVTDKTKQNIRDGRRDLDARFGKKTYISADGETIKIIKWFGYKLHIIMDTKYGVPVGFYVTPANASDYKNLTPLVDQVEKYHPEIIERAEVLTADRGYDSEENNGFLWKVHGIIPVIDKRKLWKNRKETRPLNEDKVDSIVYDEQGHLHCVCPVTGTQRNMAFQGFEKDRNTLKYRCPAAAYGLDCKGRKLCEKNANIKSDFGRVVRVSAEGNTRRFSPVVHGSPKWERLYNERSAVERLNYRLKFLFHVGQRKLRGINNFRLDVAMSMAVLMTVFVARVEAKDVQNYRSLYEPLPIAA